MHFKDYYFILAILSLISLVLAEWNYEMNFARRDGPKIIKYDLENLLTEFMIMLLTILAIVALFVK
jgi:hypothetical protein